MTGLPINSVYINKHLHRYSKKDFQYNMSNTMEEFFKVKDFRTFMGRRNTIVEEYLKKSSRERDQFEH